MSYKLHLARRTQDPFRGFVQPERILLEYLLRSSNVTSFRKLLVLPGFCRKGDRRVWPQKVYVTSPSCSHLCLFSTFLSAPADPSNAHLPRPGGASAGLRASLLGPAPLAGATILSLQQPARGPYSCRTPAGSASPVGGLHSVVIVSIRWCRELGHAERVPAHRLL